MADVSRLPEALQLKILAMVVGAEKDGERAATRTVPGSDGDSAPSAAAAAHTATAEPQPTHTTTAEPQPALQPVGDATSQIIGLASRLLSHGFSWQDEFVPLSSAARLLESARQQQLTPAAMSGSVARLLDPSLRGDSTVWLPLRADASWADSPALAHFRNALAALVERINSTNVRNSAKRNSAKRNSAETNSAETNSDEINSAERNSADAAADGLDERLELPEKLMLAHYPAGGRYVRHADASPLVPHRRLTAILYLNEVCARRAEASEKERAHTFAPTTDAPPNGGRVAARGVAAWRDKVTDEVTP